MTVNWKKLKKPWTKSQCRSRYVEGVDAIGLRGLSADSGQVRTTLEDWSRKDGWVEQRKEYQLKLQDATQQLTIEKTSERLSDRLSEIAIANYERQRLARDYAGKVFQIKAKQLDAVKGDDIDKQSTQVRNLHSGQEMNYWSQILTRATDSISRTLAMDADKNPQSEDIRVEVNYSDDSPTI